jgi:creatinine amidohydrolase
MGAIEAHSAHLPLATDNYLVETYTNILAEKTDSLVLPIIPFGQTWSLQFAPGSIHIEEETLVSFLTDVLLSLDRQGVKMVTLVSSHFGNINAMKLVARKVYEKIPLKVIYFTYPGIGKAKLGFERLNDHSLFLHADEVETSMLMHVKPESVNMKYLQKGLLNVPKEADYTPVRWTEFSTSYVIGDASLSTPEKGRLALEIIIEEATRIILTEKEKLKKDGK